MNGLIRARAREKLATIEAVEEAILLTAPYVASSQTKNQAAITVSTQALRDTTGNLPPMPGIFPDYMTPIVRNALDGDRTGRRGLEAATPPARRHAQDHRQGQQEGWRGMNAKRMETIGKVTAWAGR